jgi:hypothetical protein
MLEEILTNIAAMIPGPPAQAGLPPETLPISYLCSGVGALILGKFTGSVGNLTMPINYSVLLIGALLANWFFGGIDLPIDHQIQQPLLISIGGMLFGAFAMIWWLGNQEQTT